MNGEYNEERVIAGCRKGEAKCQQMLYDKYASKLYGLCRRYVMSDEEAQDILQDSFVKIFLNINQYEGKGSLESWMCKIAVNTAIANYHKRFASQYQEDIDELANMIPDNSVHETDYLSRDLLLSFIRELPIGYRTVFNMYEIDGYTHEEIAQKMKISPVTSRTQLLKAKKALQFKIESYLKKGQLF